MRNAWCAVLASIAVAACSDEDLAVAAAQMVAVPEAMDFGGVYVGERADRELELRNEGRGEALVQLARIPDAFAVEPSSVRVRPGGSARLSLTFRPGAPGAVEEQAVFEIGGVDGGGELVVGLAGVGLVRDVEVADLSFGDVLVGTVATLPFPLRSASQAPLRVTLALTGADAAAFQLTRTEVELAAGGADEVQISFAPPARGPRNAQLEVRACDGCRPTVVRLDGRGVVVGVEASPAALDFGRVSAGSQLARTVELRNRGDLAVRVEAATLDPAGSDQFVAELGDLPWTLAPGELRVVDVRFAPPVGADFVEQTSALRFELDRVEPIEVLLRGTPGGPSLHVDPPVIDFAIQPVGLQADRPLVVSNRGEAMSVRVLGMYVEAADGQVFAVHPHRELPWDVGTEPLPVTVTFEADRQAAFAGELLVVTDDDEQPLLRVPLVGEGREAAPCDLDVRPPTVRFGLVPRDVESTRAVEIRNRGVADCFVWDVALEPGSASQFSLAGAPDGTTIVPPGGSLEVVVRFVPGAGERRHEATLGFSHSTPEAPRIRIPVSAYPTMYWVIAQPNPLDLGDWPVGFRNLESLEIRNPSAADVTITSVARSDATPVNFAATPLPGMPGRLAPGEAGTWHVSFAPSAPGAVAGQLEVWIAEAPEPAIVDLRGAGTDVPCGDLCAGPIAFCPGDSTINVNSELQLVGAGTDPTNDPLTCTWSVTQAPPGSSAAPAPPTDCVTAFTPDIVGDYQLRLRVRDPLGNESSCTTLVHANPFGGLWIEMYWSPAGDIDLHLLHPNGGNPHVWASWEDQQWACFFSNCVFAQPEWDTVSPNDNPSLDRDDTQGTGPENIRVHVPSKLHPYRLGFRNWSNLNFPVSVTYNVWCGGNLVHSQAYQSTQDDEVIYVGDVTYDDAGPCTFVPDGTVIPKP